jgi:hypothetical protein
MYNKDSTQYGSARFMIESPDILDCGAAKNVLFFELPDSRLWRGMMVCAAGAFHDKLDKDFTCLGLTSLR